MKYVILVAEEKALGFSRAYPFIFPEYLVHKHVAEHMVHLLGMEENKDSTVLSAGFCHLHNGEWQTEHGSESLGIARDSRKGHRDHKILNMPNAMQGILFDGVEHA